ncbi:MAG: hypothetical protein GY765_02945, partial [bacterium]|nr:hypothetical protein [bacterium]
MKRITLTALRLGLLVAVSLALFSGLSIAAPQADNADEMVKKCITALGGQKGVASFRDFSAKGDLIVYIMNMELSGTIKLINKGRKNRMDGEVNFSNNMMGITLAFDGKAGWMDRMGTLAGKPALNFQSDLDHTLLLLLDKNSVFSIAW